MSDHFSFDISPFDALTATERTRLDAAATIARHPAGQTLLLPGAAPPFLYVVQGGHVQFEEDAQTHILHAGDCFPRRALFTGQTAARASSVDAVTLWQLPADLVKDLLAGNVNFSARVFSGIGQHLAHGAAEGQQREWMALLLVRVRDSYLQKPFYIDGECDLVSACQLLADKRMTHALVRDQAGVQPRVGMFTTTDLRDALLKGVPPQQLQLRDVAHFDLVSLPGDADVSDALVAMLRHRVHRIVVRDGDEILGVLSQLDLMSFLSSHSHLITLQVEIARTVDDLCQAARQVDDSIRTLQQGGMRVEIISRLVSELNVQIFSRLWTLIAPEDLVRNSCLMVMGSEGRSEQILKTDQDNALLLRDGYTCDNLPAITRAFSDALLRFGYPPCPGDIMVTNPLWCQPVAAFRETVGHWLYDAKPEGKMHLAIFMDSRAVAGDSSLLANVRAHAMNVVIGSSTYLARMASAIDQFSEPASGWWSRLTSLQSREPEAFDLKKIGTFPIVHGARVLALEHRLEALSTVDRLQALSSLQVLPQKLAKDLIETLQLLMALKLRNNLRQQALELPLSNLIELDSLGTLDRDLLKDALTIVRQFKQHLRLHYRLSAE